MNDTEELEIIERQCPNCQMTLVITNGACVRCSYCGLKDCDLWNTF